MLHIATSKSAANISLYKHWTSHGSSYARASLSREGPLIDIQLRLIHLRMANRYFSHLKR